MQHVFAGQATSILIDFIVDDEFVMPDVGTVNYTVRDNTGNPVVGHISVAVVTTTETTTISVVIPAEVNTNALEFENRFMTVEFQVGGQSYQIQKIYRVINWINISAQRHQVREHLGISPQELPENEVDLIEAYYDVKEDLGSTDLDTILTAGSRLTFYANWMIIYKAALKALPSLQLRVLQSEKTDTLQRARLAKIDLDKLGRDTSAVYSNAKAIVTGVVTENPTLLLVTTEIDPVTGA
jgi:hypothetical protein